MNKQLLFIFSLVTACNLFAQELPGNIKLELRDRLTKTPLSLTASTVIINSSDTLFLTTDKEGSVLIKNVKKGKNDVYAFCDKYKSLTVSGIIVGEGKTAYVTIPFLPDRPLTRKEKKTLGIK